MQCWCLVCKISPLPVAAGTDKIVKGGNALRLVVAVDGPAGSGKSSVCRRAALDLGIQYIDSGAIYRAITLYFLEKYGDSHREYDPGADIQNVEIKQIYRPDGSVSTILNGRDVSLEIRDESISKNIGFFSDNRGVREYVNKLLREWAGEHSIIMDGRDIGTVVFPDAEVKIYLDATVDERTARRVKEYRDQGKNVDENSIRNQIIQRDFNDSSREFGALKRADDAVFLDTSLMNFDEVVEKLKELINSKDIHKK